MEYAAACFGLSKRRGCRTVGLARSSWVYRPKSRSREDRIRERMREIAAKKHSWGCPLIHKVLKREGLALEVDTSLGGARVSRVLDRIVAQRGRPEFIRSDNGPEFTGQALDEWAYRNRVKLDLLDPGKPTQNAFIESFNSLLRRECLNDHWFTSVQQAREIIEGWRVEYNNDRPHGSLDDLTPQEFATKSRQELNLAVAQGAE